MLLKAEMVPLAVSAHAKFHESVYFFNRMIETRANVRLFPHHLSAFLSALRSVTFYLQAQFGRDAAFAEWYGKKQEAMRGNPLLRMLKEFRDEELHARPVALKFLQSPKLPREGILTDHVELTTTTTDESGEIKMWIKVGKEGADEEVAPEVRWVVDMPEEVDVLESCEDGLRHIDALLREWDERSKAPAKPPV